MGGKASQSTQQITIPPEVLARYNSVNATAEKAAQTPFQQYSTDPNAFVAPLTATQNAGIAGTNYYSGAAQPYYQAATQQLGAAQGAATPYYQQATQQVGQAQNVGNMLGGASLGALAAGQAAAAPLQQQASSGLSAAYGQAQPFNQAAAGQYQQAFGQGQNLTQGALGGVQGAYAGAQPFQNLASQYMGAGAQAVNPGELGSNQINQFMSPYLSNVLQGTAGMLNQQNQQAMSGQTGNAIRQGAFGGDRAGIAAANLAQQQQLANAQTFSNILNQGYGQALTAAQGQQQLGLGAEQANRAALQQASQQALGIGQQGFGQGLSAAQQQAALGQQLYGMGSGTGQNLSALGQQVYGQGTGTAQQQAALGQQLFGQGATASQQLAGLGQQQFAQGLNAAQQNAALGSGLYGMGSQTSQQLAALGQGAQGSGLQGAQAQLAAGLAQQQTQQAGQTALYNQFLQQQSYPFQTAQFLANIAEGTGALSGSTTTTNQAMGGFSDARLKENIKPIGKTFDGQKIYSYNFKGQPQTEIGLIAQEVEKHHPEAVGLAGGYKTVRYDKATDDAADRGHFAAGGAASMGGGVMPEHAGLGFADGGFIGFDPGLYQQMLQSYQQMYAPMQGGEKGGLGAAGYVPAASGSVGSLQTAGELPEMQSPMANAKGMADTAASIGELGAKVGAWKYGGEETAGHSARSAIAAGNKVQGDRLKSWADAPIDHKDPTKDIDPMSLANTQKRGGRIGLAGGGTPYQSDVPTEIKIPDQENKHELVKPDNPPTPPKDNTADIISTLAKVAMMAAARGGRAGYAIGGGTPYSSGPTGLDIPDEQGKHDLMKAGATPDQGSGGGGLGDIAGIASTAASFIPGGGIASKGLGMLGKIFSDKRMKENIKPIGKTFDGQTVYSYNYKGDHQTRMGLIAQEVEKHHPEAVGSSHGMKTVDYHKATGVAAHRGHFAEGGLVGGYAEGGFADDLDENPILKRLMRQLNPFLTEEEERGEDLNKPHELTGLAPRERIIPEIRKEPAGLASGFANRSEERSAPVSTGKVDPDIVTFFMNKGLTEGQALGIAAGIHAESASNPIAMNRQSGAMGLGQWLGGRKAGLMRQFGDAPSKTDQLEYLWGELTGGDRGGSAVLAQKDPKAVLGAYITRFMRPAAGHETESDISRGHAAMGYASGGLAGGRHGYALDGAVGAPENILPDFYRDVTPDDAAKIGEESTATGSITPTNMARLVRSAGTPEKVSQLYSLMDQKGLGIANEMPPSATPPQAAAPQATDKRPLLPNGQPDRGFLGNIAHGDFVSGIGQGKATSWIPLLTGLATWGTTPTRSALSGALAGIGAGAQAAQAQREYGLKGRQVGAVEMEAVSDRIRANSDLLRAELTNAEQLNGAIQNTTMMIAMARRSGMDPRELNAQLVALNNRRNKIVLQGGGGGEGGNAAPGLTSSPYSGLKPYDPTNAASVAEQADIEQMGGGTMPSTNTRLSLAGQGITLNPSGEFGNVPSYGPAKGGVRAAEDYPSQQQADNREFVTSIRNDFSQYGDSAPIVQSIPPAISTQPTPDFVRDLQTKVAGILKMTPNQASEAFGTSYDAAALAKMGSYLGIPIDTSQPVAATNALLNGLHTRFDNLGRKYQAVKQIEAFAGKQGTTVYDPRFDVRGHVTDYIYGRGKQ